MSENLSTFLVDLAVDSNLMAQFLTDPAALLEQTNLTPNEKSAIMSRDSRRVTAALGVEYLANGVANKGGRKGHGRKGGGRKGARKGTRKAPAKKKATR